MLGWALMFLIVAIVAAALGFTGIAIISVELPGFYSSFSLFFSLSR